jgi:hypothetical protein
VAYWRSRYSASASPSSALPEAASVRADPNALRAAASPSRRAAQPCSGTLVSPTIVVSAGHCTFGTGLNGEPTPTGSGGNDVWISFAEVPDYSILPPSTTWGSCGSASR